MPRHARGIRGGVVYHVYNRAHQGARLFTTDEDFRIFQAMMHRAHDRVPIRILSYCIMPTHWHIVLWPKTDAQLAEFMRWLTVTHAQHFHIQHELTGAGNVYESRYRSFPVQEGQPLLTLCRYIESNPVRAKLVKKAEDWKWGSLYLRRNAVPEDQKLVSTPPTKRPANWLTLVNRPMSEAELTAARTSIQRGRPFGEETWLKRTVKNMQLEWTMRSRGRPRKVVAKSAK